MKTLSKFALLISAGAFTMQAHASLPWESEQPDFLPHEQAFVLTQQQDDDTLTLTWMVEPGYYLYDHAFEVAGVPNAVLTRQTTPIPYHDEFFGDIHKHVDTATLTVPNRYLRKDTVQVTYRGCADAGLCYPPVSMTLPVDAYSGHRGTVQTFFGVPVPVISYAFNQLKTFVANAMDIQPEQEIAQ